MTASRIVELHCDQPGCDTRFVVTHISIWKARQLARFDRDWRVDVANLDFCAQHRTKKQRREAGA